MNNRETFLAALGITAFVIVALVITYAVYRYYDDRNQMMHEERVKLLDKAQSVGFDPCDMCIQRAYYNLQNTQRIVVAAPLENRGE